MAQVEYAFIRLKGGLYDEDLRQRLGTFFDLAVGCCGMRGQEAAEILIASGLAAQLECLNPGFVAGKSGAELLQWAFSACGVQASVANPPRVPTSADYWTGYMLGLFQLRTGWTYAQVFGRATYADLRELHSWCLDKAEMEVVGILLDRLRGASPPCPLRAMRKAAGLTQAQLAQLAGVSSRSIQQYEEGRKSINKAAVESVRRIALVLGCTVEALLEPAGL